MTVLTWNKFEINFHVIFANSNLVKFRVNFSLISAKSTLINVDSSIFGTNYLSLTLIATGYFVTIIITESGTDLNTQKEMKLIQSNPVKLFRRVMQHFRHFSPVL